MPFEVLPSKQWSLLAPGGGYHQHFNTTAEPIRYLVLRRGNPELAGDAGGEAQNAGMQIHFEEEDPAVWELFVSELRKRGLESAMAPTGRRCKTRVRHGPGRSPRAAGGPPGAIAPGGGGWPPPLGGGGGSPGGGRITRPGQARPRGLQERPKGRRSGPPEGVTAA